MSKIVKILIFSSGIILFTAFLIKLFSDPEIFDSKFAALVDLPKISQGKQESEVKNNSQDEPSFFNFGFDSFPKNANYELILSDGSKREGKTPFKEKISGGNLKIKLSLAGYNFLEQEVVAEGDNQELYYLDKEGQLVHHLFDIKPAPAAKGVAFSPDGKEIWATLLLNKKRGLSIFDSSSGELIRDINLNDGGGVEIIFSLDGKKAYVSQMETAKVYEIDVETKKILRIFDTESAWTKVLELSKDGKTLFASNWSGNDVSEFDLAEAKSDLAEAESDSAEGKLIRRIRTVKTPRGLYATADGNFLYVAGFDAGEIEKIDLKTGKGRVIYKSNGAMRHIVADEQRGIIYISDMGKNIVWQVSLKTDEVKKFVSTDNNPNTIALSPDKKILFVSCRGINFSPDNYYIPGSEWGSVLLFDAENGKMLDAIIAGNQPTALDVSRDGKFLIFSDFLDAKMEIFEIPSSDFLKNGNGGRSKVYQKEIKK